LKYPWWKGAVIYQVYPRSFYDSNNDGVGDLKGIVEKLDYFQWLGVDAIWLSPIFKSPMVDFGYDISDYRNIDPIFGTMEDFDLLLEESHKRGIRVILDQVYNHTSDQHPWFLESKSSKINPKADWYIWKDGEPGKFPNNWQSFFGGPAWQWYEERKQYYLHLFTKEQPDLNWRNPQVKKAVFDTIDFWLKKGVDGFRFDVVNMFCKDIKFRDNPTEESGEQQAIFNTDRPETLLVVEEIQELVEKYPGRVTIGEVASPQGLYSYLEYTKPGRLNLAFNFEFMNIPAFEATLFRKIVEDTERIFKNLSWPCYVLGNHDCKRVRSRYSGGESIDESMEKCKLLATMLLTLRGTSMIYYGEEIGMEEMIIPYEEIQDPEGKNLWPEKIGRDGCRTPMQWNNSQYGGFSSIKPWLPVNQNRTEINVEKQKNDPNSLLNFYRSLIKLRKGSNALKLGKLSVLKSSKNVFAYLRSWKEEQIIVALNFSSENISADLKLTGKAKVIHSNRRRINEICRLQNLELCSYEALILKLYE
jgi:alpha-glucosidase